MPREPAMRGADLDWNRELCKQGCREWIPWYQDKKGKTVYGCRLGVIPEKRSGQWCCRKEEKPTNYERATDIEKPKGNERASLPEFREYARLKYPNELDEDLITMIEDLIERQRKLQESMEQLGGRTR